APIAEHDDDTVGSGSRQENFFMRAISYSIQATRSSESQYVGLDLYPPIRLRSIPRSKTGAVIRKASIDTEIRYSRSAHALAVRAVARVDERRLKRTYSNPKKSAQQ
ncbi:hypothetical protein ACI6Q5_22125, partial [Xanthomonas codiaei]